MQRPVRDEVAEMVVLTSVALPGGLGHDLSRIQRVLSAGGRVHLTTA